MNKVQMQAAIQSDVPLGAFLVSVARFNLTYKQKVILIFLRAVGDWASTHEIEEGIGTSATTAGSGNRCLSTLYDLGLIERKGSRPTGYDYRVRSA